MKGFYAQMSECERPFIIQALQKYNYVSTSLCKTKIKFSRERRVVLFFGGGSCENIHQTDQRLLLFRFWCYIRCSDYTSKITSCLNPCNCMDAVCFRKLVSRFVISYHLFYFCSFVVVDCNTFSSLSSQRSLHIPIYW